MIIVIAMLGLIRSYFHLKASAWFTPPLIIRILQGLWVAVVIAAMIMVVIFLLPAKIDP